MRDTRRVSVFDSLWRMINAANTDDHLMKKDPEATSPVIGSGNFLADCGYADPDEARVKFELANRIAVRMEQQKMRQAEICLLTGLKQPDISKVVNGRVSGFSVWRLLQILKGLGENVTISVTAADSNSSQELALSL